MTSGRGRIVVAFCHPGEVAGLFNDSLIQLLLHDARKNRRIVNGGGIVSLGSGPRIASARNQLVRHFLAYRDQPEWLWMVDADMTFAADTLDRLVNTATANDVKILGGLCFGGGRGGLVFPTLYQMHEPNADNHVVGVVEDYPEDALVKVDATGAACLLIHRSALTSMLEVFGTVDTPQGRAVSPAPWFAETFYAGREFGEDWTFCMRAQQVGVDVMVHTGIKLGHVKSRLLDEQAFEEFRKQRAELGSEQAVVEQYRDRMLSGEQ